MKKERSPHDARSERARTPSLAELRAAIDKVDRELVKQVNERAKLAVEIARLKDSSGGATFVPGREDEVLAQALEHNKGPLSADSVRAVFREILSGSRRLEKQLRVAFLGPLYSFSHLATLHRFGAGIELVPVATIAAVFEEVNRKHADYGLVPIENSTDGRIADTLDMFTRLRVRICSEVQLRIHHTLLGRCPRSDVKEVYSKPQALSQCRNWLVKHLPAARPIEVTSTTTAAQLALDKPGAAAIASVEAGVQYGLDVLAENIEDNPDNTTRFAVIGAESAARSGRDKTAAMFQIEHRPGSLAEAINIFKRNRLNLTWIESFPIARGEYMFFIELDGHESDLRVRRAFAALGKKALRLEILGSYPRTEAVG
ncbi:MAG: prephenate dehydratase [Planctomycetia bacterium]|nr:prephenate dehydratase [Planctomycetia bacterium]